MTAFSNFLEEALLQEIFNNVNFAPPTTHVALFNTPGPGEDNAGTANELTGVGSYVRITVNPATGGAPEWNAAILDGAGFLVDNADDITFPVATADWGTITDVGIYDALTVGNLLYLGTLTSPVVINTDGQFVFAAGTLDLRTE